MRTKKHLRTLCVKSEKIQNFFKALSQSITSGCDKVWMSEERNEEISFIVGNERINISAAALKKGGLL